MFSRFAQLFQNPLQLLYVLPAIIVHVLVDLRLLLLTPLVDAPAPAPVPPPARW